MHAYDAYKQKFTPKKFMLKMGDEKILLATELTQLCLVPELIADIDVHQIEPQHFDNFRKILNENLHLLFDLIQQNESILFNNIKETRTFRTNLILLLCEQSAENVPCGSDQFILIQNVNYLLDKWLVELMNDRNVFELVTQTYKAKIKVNVWKRNIGAVFGFHRFCHVYFRKHVSKLDLNEVFFLLATGTLLLEHYEPQYKELGIDLYLVLFKCSNKTDIVSTNMHQAIYTTCSGNIAKIQNEKTNLKLWECLYECLQLDDSWKCTSNWHKINELMMDLLKRIAFEGNIRRSTILFYFASKFGSLPYKNNSVIKEFTDLNQSQKMLRNSFDTNFMTTKFDWDALRNECQTHNSHIVYKWIKKMLSLIGNQNMFFGDTLEVAFNLHAIHLTYIIWILSVPLNLISSQIQELHLKLTPTLLECYRRYKLSPFVCEEIRQLFVTFTMHFNHNKISLRGENVKLHRRFETLEIIKDALR